MTDDRAPAPRSSAPPPPVSFERQLLARATFGGDRSTAAQLSRMGAAAWLEWQLDPQSIDDTYIEARLHSLIKASDNAGADVRMLARALFSRRQLAWRMVYFLNNHFATFRGRTVGISESKEDDAFYAGCFGRFADVLKVSAMSPAMIDFLDSNSNIAGNPNENYSRELMELHTVGVNGGYTEPDVRELARVFTGWSRTNVPGGPQEPPGDSYFTFNPGDHDAGPKSLSLGWSTPGIGGPNGMMEGRHLLNFLAGLPQTASFFTAKLCRYFVSDSPPAGLLARVEQVFTSSGGNLRDTVRAVFLDPEFATASTEQSKVHDGFELVVNLLRRFYKSPPTDLLAINERIGRLGSQPHGFPVPTGYPEVGAAWQGPGRLLPRWQLVDDYAYDRIPGTSVPWAQVFLTMPTGGHGYVSILLDWVCDGQVPVTTKTALTVFMDNRLAALPANPTWAQVLPHARALLALILKLPEVQLH